MSVAAVMLVKDEADIIGHTVAHLLEQVDTVIVSDNGSTDGTREILDRISEDDLRLVVLSDHETGYYQDTKTTRLAHTAREFGHEWVVPCDADEWWYSPFGRVGDVLEQLEPDALFADARILNHITTGIDDPADENPLTRIGWRIKALGELPKVACRLTEHLHIHMGNHSATSMGLVHSMLGATVPGQLYIHHYPWRSRPQFIRKITNGALAYAAAPEMPEHFGGHWRQFGMPDDEGFTERVVAWFDDWGYRADPYAEGHAGGELVYQPAGQ